MPQPPPYDRQFNFQNQQLQTPAAPNPAEELDAEYNAIKITLDATLGNLELIQRDDGQLANETVGVDQLKPELDGFADTAAAAVAAAVAAEASAVAAASAAGSASTSAMAANTARSDAQLAETNAELAQTASEAAATASAASAAQLIGTSSTSVTIGPGAQTFTTQTGKFFNAGTWLLITSDAAPSTDYMHGVAISYGGATLFVNVTNIGGSGEHSDWTIRVSGTRGAIGATGADGVAGAPGAPGASGAPGIQFNFAAETADADPGPGAFRFNNADPTLATALYIDNQEITGTNVEAWLDTFDDAGDAAGRGNLQIIDPNNTARFYIFVVTGSVVDGTGYRKVSVTYVSGTGAFVVASPISFAFFRRGPTGAAGPGVSDGDYGDIVVSAGGTAINIDSSVLTAFGRTILDDADGATVRATIGAGTGSGDVTAAAAFATDERLLRSDGTGKGVQASPASLTDAGALSGLTTVVTSGAITVGTTAGTAPIIDPSGFGQMPEIAAPTTPATGFVRLYAKADGHLYQKDDAGLETDLAAAGGGASTEPQKCGRLSYVSATAIKFVPYDGDLIKINGALYSIPSAGIAGVANTSVFVNGTGGQNLGASTLYYVYAFVNSGAVTADFSTTAHATSATSGNVGVEIKSGDDTRTLIGMIRTNASSQFVDSATQRFVRSWFNHPGKTLRNWFTAVRSTASATFVELNTEIRVEYLVWANEVIVVQAQGGLSNLSTTNAVFAGLSFDSTTVAEGPGAWLNPAGAAVYAPCAITINKAGLSEGYHYSSVLGRRNVGGSMAAYSVGDAEDGFFILGKV